MVPLAIVGAQFGIVDVWPSYMLIDMFLWEPNSRVMKKVGAFMYGNSVRLSDAVACYNAGNRRYKSRVEAVLRAWYDTWNRIENRRHL
jgi:hypothetical protein